jgi:hypothetical protein
LLQNSTDCHSFHSSHAVQTNFDFSARDSGEIERILKLDSKELQSLFRKENQQPTYQWRKSMDL